MDWDFFLAHASQSSSVAEELRSLLEAAGATAFEDSMLKAGEDWDTALDRHQRAAAITVVIISAATRRADYQREEIARGINLARTDPNHRVIPLIVEPVDIGTLPYGLAIKTPVKLSSQFNLAQAAQVLLESLHDLREPRNEGPREASIDIGDTLDLLDRAALAGGGSEILEAALGEVDNPELRLHLRRRGLDPRVLLPSLPDHKEALIRWSLGAEDVQGTDDFLAAIHRQLIWALADSRSDLSPSALSVRREVISGPATSLTGGRLAVALARRLPPWLRSTSTEAVLFDPTTAAISGSTSIVESAQSGQPAPSRSAEQHHDEAASSSSPAELDSSNLLNRKALAMTALPASDQLAMGRESLLSDVVARVDAGLAARGSITAFLNGPLGSGVSTMALEAARALVDRFPGGVRYIDLRGLDEDARRRAADVAKLVCYSLGDSPVAGSELEQYRSVLDGRGVLLILDNALDAKHVARLVPAPRTCGVIVTSRNRTQGYADRELVIHVPPLSRTDSIAMLSAIRGSGDNDKPALDQVAQACADLPMALQLVSVWITNDPEASLTSLARQLSAEKARLEYLDDGIRAMRAAIGLSYSQLDEDARRTFRFLPAVPGSAATGVYLGRGLERDPDLVELTLYRLVDHSVAGLVASDSNDTPSFRLFELVRLFALERLEDEDPPEVVARFRRLLVASTIEDVRRDEADPGLRLDSTTITAARAAAEREQWFDLAADLTDNLRAVHEADLDTDSVRRDHSRSAELRERAGDVEGAVRAHLALAHLLAGAEAEKAFTTAELIARKAGRLRLIGEAAFEVSKFYHRQQEFEKSVAAGERAFTALCDSGQPTAAAPVGINNITAAMEYDRALARSWVERTQAIINATTPLNLRASLAWDDARLSNNRIAVERWRYASRLMYEDHSFRDAGRAALFGAEAAFQNSSLAEASELFLNAAELLRRSDDLDNEIRAMIGLSTAYTVVDQLANARDILDRLLNRIAVQEVWHQGVVAELALRIAVLSYLRDGTTPELDLLPGLPQGDDTAEAGSHLSDVRAALADPERAHNMLYAFATSGMVYEPPGPDLWIYEDLGEEPPEQLQLT